MRSSVSSGSAPVVIRFSRTSVSSIRSRLIPEPGAPASGKRSCQSRWRAYVQRDTIQQSSGRSATTRKPRTSISQPAGGSMEPRDETGSKFVMTTNCHGLAGRKLLMPAVALPPTKLDRRGKPAYLLPYLIYGKIIYGMIIYGMIIYGMIIYGKDAKKLNRFR